MKKINLTTQIVIGLILGIILGAWYRETWPDPANITPFADNMHILSDIFLRLIKMIIAPLSFRYCSQELQKSAISILSEELD